MADFCYDCYKHMFGDNAGECDLAGLIKEEQVLTSECLPNEINHHHLVFLGKRGALLNQSITNYLVNSH